MSDLPPTPAGEPEGTPVPDDAMPAYGASDAEVSAAYGPVDTVEAAPSRAGRRGIVIGALAAVLAVVAGAAVYAASVLSGGGRQPDELVPKSAYAFAKIDLDPAAGQKLAARSFFEKFPNLKGKTGTADDNPFDKVFEDLMHDSDVSYATDIKPWFDRRAAIATYPGPGNDPVVVGVVRSKDDAKARASLDKLIAKGKANDPTQEMAYDITKGYVVISDTKAHVDDAIAKSEQASLRDNESYRHDVDTLTGDQVAVGWVDIQPAYKGATAHAPQAGLIPSAITDKIHGRVVSGLHFSGDYVELEGRASDVDPTFVTPGGDVSLLKRLPASTVAALSITGLSKSVNNILSLTGASPDALVGQFLEGTGIHVTDDVLPLLGDQTVLALGNVDAFFSDAASGIRAALLTKVADPEKARQSGAKIAALLSHFNVDVRSAVDGDTFVLATPAEYTASLAKGSGGLTTSPKFTKATGDLGSPSAVLYIDLQKVLNADPGTPESAFRSFGIVSGFDGGTAFFHARLVVG